VAPWYLEYCEAYGGAPGLSPEPNERARVLGDVDIKPKTITQLEQYAARIGAPVKIEPTVHGYRLLVEATADPALDKKLVDYMGADLGLALEEDPRDAPQNWRGLGIIVGYHEVED
jgi:hypothetical protein